MRPKEYTLEEMEARAEYLRQAGMEGIVNVAADFIDMFHQLIAMVKGQSAT